MHRIQDGTEEKKPARLADLVASASASAIALAAGVVLVLAGLGVDRLNGDEHNAIAFLTEGLWEYIKAFHYGHLVKIQIWTLHELFGNSFFWYRMPAALSAIAVLVWLALYRAYGVPANRVAQALVVLALAGNAAFLNFARWGIPNYSEAILACSVLIGPILVDVMKGRVPAWGWGRALLIVVLPWLYPATVLLLGGISVYLVLDATIRHWKRNDIAGVARGWLAALVPVMLGAASLAAFRLSIPDAHWERARHHHKAFKAWQAQGGDGGMVGFAKDSLAALADQFQQLTPLAAESSYQWVASVYSWLVALLAVVVIASLAIAGWRSYRMRGRMPDVDVGFLRGAMFLLTCVAAVIAVAIAAAAFELFPMISLRYLFFVITLPALLAVIALGYLGHLAGPWLAGNHGRVVTGIGKFAGVATVTVIGMALALAVTTQRRVESGKYQPIHTILQSAGNDIVFSWAPGFYFAGATLVHAPKFFQVDRGNDLPRGLAQAIRMQRKSLDGGTIAILTTSAIVGGSGSPLDELVQAYDLRLENQSGYNNFEAFTLRIPPLGAVEPEKKTIDITIDLPAGEIDSVRFDPTDYLQAAVTIDSMVYIDDTGEHVVNVCDDRALASMRTKRVGGHGSCRFIFGNRENTGWIAPSALTNLDDGGAAQRRVRVRMSGELSSEFLVYLDTGKGYSSPIRIKVDRTVAH